MSLTNSNSLKGSDAINRARQLMSLNENVQPKTSTRGIVLTKAGSDNNVYAIVKESSKFFIKKAPLNETIHHSDFDYVNGEASKTNFMFEGYNLALKSFNNIMIALNENFGRKEANNFEIDYSDKETVEEADMVALGDDIEFVVEDENDDYGTTGHIEFEDDVEIFGDDEAVSVFEKTENKMFEALDQLSEIVEEGLKKKN